MVWSLIRFAIALLLVFATWNPSGQSYFDWAMGATEVNATLAFAGVVLLIGWVLFLRAALHALGLIGIGLAGAFFGTLIWVLIDQGWLSTDESVLNYVVLVFLALILTVGMSWSHVWRRMSGQIDVD